MENAFCFSLALLSMPTTSSAQRRRWHWSWIVLCITLIMSLEMSVVMVLGIRCVLSSSSFIFLFVVHFHSCTEFTVFLLLPRSFIDVKRHSHQHVQYFCWVLSSFKLISCKDLAVQLGGLNVENSTVGLCGAACVLQLKWIQWIWVFLLFSRDLFKVSIS